VAGQKEQGREGIKLETSRRGEPVRKSLLTTRPGAGGGEGTGKRSEGDSKKASAPVSGEFLGQMGELGILGRAGLVRRDWKKCKDRLLSEGLRGHVSGPQDL